MCVPWKKLTPLLHFLWPSSFCGFGFGPKAVTNDWTLLGICGKLFCSTYKFSERSHTKPLVRGQVSVCFCCPVFIWFLSVYVDIHNWNANGRGKNYISVQSWETHYLLLGSLSSGVIALFIMFILACLFVLEKDIKTAQTDAWDERHRDKRKSEGAKTHIEQYINYTYNTYSLITVALKKLLRILQKQPCFHLACNFEIIH